VRRFLFSLSLTVSGLLYAEDRGLFLHYDFTQPAIRQGGICRQPELPPNMTISCPEYSLILTGNFSQPELSVPESTFFSLKNGGTLYALVRFNQRGMESGQQDAHDMIFFKQDNLLFGRDCGELYFNMQTSGRWCWAVRAPDIPTGRWTALAATVTKNGTKNYTVRLYIDGRKAAEKTFLQEMDGPNGNPVAIGRGWGGPWCFCGLLGKLMIFNYALTDDDVAGLCREEPYLKK